MTEPTQKKPIVPPEEPERPQGSEPKIEPEDLLVGSPETDPVNRAYARTGHQDTTGISGLPAGDEDAGEERKKLYEAGAKLVSRVD
jgi:hypothetical protein